MTSLAFLRRFALSPHLLPAGLQHFVMPEHCPEERCLSIVESRIVLSKDRAVRARALEEELTRSYFADEEGLVVKDLESQYGIGERNKGWFKVKHDTLNTGRGTQELYVVASLLATPPPPCSPSCRRPRTGTSSCLAATTAAVHGTKASSRTFSSACRSHSRKERSRERTATRACL